MKLRLDLLELVREEDIIDFGDTHRYSAEPVFAKTGVGYLKPATEADIAREIQASEEFQQKLLQRLAEKQALQKKQLRVS